MSYRVKCSKNATGSLNQLSSDGDTLAANRMECLYTVYLIRVNLLSTNDLKHEWRGAFQTSLYLDIPPSGASHFTFHYNMPLVFP